MSTNESRGRNVTQTLFCYSDISEAPLTFYSLPGTNAAFLWLRVMHLIWLSLIVLTSHRPAMFMGIFLFFLGLTTITKELQEQLNLKESLLVAFFLA